MPELVSISRKPETLQGFQLNVPDDMMAALQYISAGGYSGHINLSGDGVWTMGIQHPTVSQAARIGDVIVIKNGAVAEVATPAQFAAMYSV